MAEKTSLPKVANVDPEDRLVELICTECRLCGAMSPWLKQDTAWDVEHYKAEHPYLPSARDWSTYRWTVTRQIPRYF